LGLGQCFILRNTDYNQPTLCPQLVRVSGEARGIGFRLVFFIRKLSFTINPRLEPSGLGSLAKPEGLGLG
jgi:hypothetical protein